MFLSLALLLFGAVACQTTTTTVTTASTATTATTTQVANTLPVLAGVSNKDVYLGDPFDPLAGVSASDAEDGNITGIIVVTGSVNIAVEGAYTLTYRVTDSDGGVATANRVITVVDVDLVYPTGFYNFKFAQTELRHTFMAAAEAYLMNNLYAGVPLFANGSFALYSSRLQLPVENYVPVMGYGTAFATMSADDSTVLMDDGEPGNVGEYTYRGAITGNPQTFNQWLYNDSVTSDVMALYLDALYTYQFNADKTGYEVVPSMAAANPVPVNSRITDTGKEVSKTWRITLKDGLVWDYNADTNISALPVGHEVIDANDFVETFKLALDESWFRAISGGGDFLSESNGIENASEYLDGEVEWDQVGIKLVDDLTLEFTFINEQSDWNVRYWASSFVMTPINIELYDALTVDGVSSYGTSETTIAYHGPYVLDYYEQDKILRYIESDVYHNPDEYFYTGYNYSVIADAAVRFAEFVAGKLEAVALPTAQYNTYKTHPGLKQIPGATTFRIMINGLETEEQQRALFPDSAWVPEPILANLNFKKAMFFAVDREKLAKQVLKTSTTNMFLFSNAYLVDAEMGIPYRNTEQGQTVGEGLSPSTYGFNADAAEAYFLLAVQELIAAGVYAKGTASAWNTIEIFFNIFSGSEAQVLMGEYIKSTFESTFQDYANFVKVKITVQTKDFPAIYYNYMMVGEFDLSIGGISGSTLDAASFLDTYCSDNRGGFTLNWGIDTSIAEIEVLYEDFNGVRHLEMWSFDAITAVLNGEVYIAEGAEADVPAAKDFEYTPTSVTFTIELFNSPLFQDITYTLQTWVGNGYVDVVGVVDIPATSETVTIEDLIPAYDGVTDYLGDYQVIINYVYSDDVEKSGSSTSQWWMQPYIIDEATKVITDTSATIGLVLNDDDYARTLTSVTVVLRSNGNPVVVTVDFSNISNIVISGLTASTGYEVIFTFNDGNIDYVNVTTTATPA